MAGFLTQAKGFWDNVLSQVEGRIFTPSVTRVGMDLSELNGGWNDAEIASRVHAALGIAKGMSPADMYRAQPHLRNVISFLGRNIAQVRVHVYEVVSENDRVRRRDSLAARVLRKPNPQSTGYQLMYGLVVDKKLYDVAYWLLTWDRGLPQLWRVPPTWVERVDKNPFEISHYRMKTSRGTVDVSPEDIIEFRGYDPTSTTKVSPAIVSLREILSEQIAATVYRSQVWERGGRVSSVLKRPAGAPKWSDEAATRFKRDWRAKWTGQGEDAGGTPVLEDGMELQRIDFNAKEQEWVDGIKLGLSIVAATYHVNPTMVGLLDNANYSNVREFRKMLYGDTLGPDFEDIQEVINAELLPRIGEEHLYAEFNIGAKLQGNFEEQAQYLQSATGASYMTRNEARARLNLPAIEGADELIIPLNVLEGGMASPTDSDPYKGLRIPGNTSQALGDTKEGRGEVSEPETGVAEKAGSSAADRRAYQKALETFFRRQRSVVLSRMGAKKEAWWDQDRWNRELSKDLYRLHISTSAAAAKRALFKARLDPNMYDEERTHEYWEEVAEEQAERINKSTKQNLDQVMDEDSDVTAEHVFDVAEGSRVKNLATTMASSVAAWGILEAGKQTGAATKTWVVTSGNPRSSHAAMNGETVWLSENFSNGMSWPGDGSIGDADELAGCQCELVINY